jgi:transaldolase
LPAIQTLLAEGINVNVTLIFSLSRYAQVLECYLRAMETRLAQGLSVNMSSVASFFVSRVDSIVDSELARLAADGFSDASVSERYFAQLGVANSVLAYEHFKRVFGSPRYKKLAKAGARIQRPLWASTSTKSAKLDPLHYVTQLAMAETVNTVPPVTLKAIIAREDLETRPAVSEEQAKLMLQGLAQLGVAFDYWLNQLEIDGVKAFAESFDALLSSISKKI